MIERNVRHASILCYTLTHTLAYAQHTHTHTQITRNTTHTHTHARRYKVHFKTIPEGPCRRADGTHAPSGKAMTHSPPLVFDVVADPGESTPLDPSTIPAAMAAIQQQSVVLTLFVVALHHTRVPFVQPSL